MTNQTDEYRQTREKIEKMIKFYSSKSGYDVISDPEIYDTIVEGLVQNKLKHGFAYCPCRIVTGSKEEDIKIICPCAYHKEEIKQDGHCHCHLFYAKER